MAFQFSEAISKEFLAKGFEKKHVELLARIAIGDGQSPPEDLSQWPTSAFAALDGFGPLSAAFAREIIQSHARATVGVNAGEDFDFPRFPPYIDSIDEYDPKDPVQYWTDRNGRSWRWCAKGINPKAQSDEGQCLICGPGAEFAHPVVVVSHEKRGDLLIPDALESSLAVNAHMQWFSRAYNCWISEDGKPLGEVPRDLRIRVKAMIDGDQEMRRMRAYGAPLPV